MLYRCALSLLIIALCLSSAEAATPTIGLPTTTPSILVSGKATTVVVSAQINDPAGTLLSSSVNVFLVDQSGTAGAILGTLNDTGASPDTVANDGLFTGAISLVGTPGKLIRLRVSAAFRGTLQRSLSDTVIVDVVPAGVPTDIAPTRISTAVIDTVSNTTMACDQVIVFFKPGTSVSIIKQSIAAIGGTIIGILPYPGRNAWQIGIPCTTAASVLSVVASLEADPNTEGAVPNSIFNIRAAVNDPQYSNQWALLKIKADQAWATAPIGIGLPSENANPKTIGIIDTGIWYPHEDLHGKVLLGYNWVDGTTLPLDDNDHGTHVAGIASAFSNNHVGIAGVMSAQKLIAEKVCNGNGECSSLDISRGIKDAVERGAQVINLSLGSSTRDEDIAAAIDYANRAGRLVVAAAGNNNCGEKSYPAAYGSNETFSHIFGFVVHTYKAQVLAVGATDQNDARSIWTTGQALCTPETGSNFGSWVNVYAPGSNILSTVRGNGYSYFDGTSMATPYVTGAASYIWSISPSASADQVKAVIIATADDTGANDPDGHRIYRLNVVEALKKIKDATIITFSEPLSFDPPATYPGSGALSFRSAKTQGFTFTAANPIVPTDTLTYFGNMIGTNISYGAIRMTKADGGLFSLTQFDTATWFPVTHPYAPYINATEIRVSGVLSGGGTVSTSFGLSGDTFLRFTLPAGWVNLSSVTFSGFAPTCPSSGCWNIRIDNVVAK